MKGTMIGYGGLYGSKVWYLTLDPPLDGYEIVALVWAFGPGESETTLEGRKGKGKERNVLRQMPGYQPVEILAAEGYELDEEVRNDLQRNGNAYSG